MIRLALVVVPFIALLGCRGENRAFCPENPGEQGCPPDGSVGESCNVSTDCKNPLFPVCNTEKAMCTQCFGAERDACTGETPRCDVDTCVACADDTADCGVGGLCLPSGACAAADSILHVTLTNASTSSDCGTAGKSPCTLETALMLAMTMPARTVIKLDQAGTYTPANSNFVVDANVTIDMRAGAVLRKKDDGPILDIKSNRTVTLLGGTIEGATGTNGDGIQCTNATLTIYDMIIRMNAESGIDTSGCTMAVTNADIRDNSKASGSTFFSGINAVGGSLTISQSQIVSNRGGGITVGNSGKFVVVGNVFFSNGDPGGTAGGLSVNTSTPGNRIEFNTFAGNKSQAGVGPGIQCIAPAGFMAQNNIIWSNGDGVQVNGACLHAYSDIGPIPVPKNPPILDLDGGNNINEDPMFTDTTIDLAVSSTSLVRGKANPTADLSGIAAKDIKGTARTLRSGAGADLGAYVVPDP